MNGAAQRLAYFVSPHGFGHAARACAVIEELGRLRPGLRYEIFTTVPEWFFAQSLTAPFTYHALDCDVGLAQNNPLEENLEETVRRLRQLLPFTPARLSPLATRLDALGCQAVVADIAPLGLAAARHAGLSAVLVENFTWDWIYAAYIDDHTDLAGPAAELSEVFAWATSRIQAEPVCRRVPHGAAVAPISRAPRRPAHETRHELGIPEDAKVVLVTMGGIQWQYQGLDALVERMDGYLLVPGASDRRARRGRLITVPFHSDLYHPDLVRASDVVLAKLGYSTLAEAYHSGCALAFIPRARFPESPVLARYALAQMAAVAMSEEEFLDGSWVTRCGELHELVPPSGPRPHGAGEAAGRILEVMDRA